MSEGTAEKIEPPVEYGRESWMNDAQYECWRLLSRVFGGFHHMTQTVKGCGPNGIRYSAPNWHTFATFDANTLTRLVLMAHRDCFRIDIEGCNRQHIYLYVHKRSGRDGEMWNRHPTIEQAIERFAK